MILDGVNLNCYLLIYIVDSNDDLLIISKTIF